jgi:hypothetical protein
LTLPLSFPAIAAEPSCSLQFLVALKSTATIHVQDRLPVAMPGQTTAATEMMYRVHHVRS